MDGEYELPVAAGSYRLVFEDEMYWGYQFYPATESYVDATVFTVSCNDTLTADFTTPVYADTTVYITVSGRVTRASDNSGVESEVVFYVADDWGFVSTPVWTDEDGYYDVELPTVTGPWNFSCIAVARPYDSDLYYQYFHSTTNPDDAVVINEGRSDVDFSLSSIPTFDNSVSGMVTDELGNAVERTVLIFPTALGADFYSYDGMINTSNGAYTLSNLAPGTYILVLVPYGESRMPGYYTGNGQTIDIRWDRAAVLEIDSTTTLSGVDMIVPGYDTEGTNVVSGTVGQNSGSIGKGDDVLGVEPLQGAMVYALNEFDEVVGSAVTGSDGSFRIARLGVGSYHLYADKIGFLSDEDDVVFAQPGDRTTVDLTLRALATTDVRESVLCSADLDTYPNPVTSHMTVRFTSLPGTVRLAVTDVSGRELLARDIRPAGGETTVQLELGTVTAGVYMVTLRAGDSVLSTPATVAR